MIDYLIKRLKWEEGTRGFPYDDATGKPVQAKGKVTIGIGRNLNANPLTITEQEYLLTNDITAVMWNLRAALPWLSRHSETVQIVLIDMAFNMGVPGLLKWKNTLEAVRLGQYNKAANNMQTSLWARQVGKRRADPLIRMMRTGVLEEVPNG